MTDPETPRSTLASAPSGRRRRQKLRPSRSEQQQSRLLAEVKAWGQEIQELEQTLQSLKERHQQVQTDLTFQTALQERCQQTQASIAATLDPATRRLLQQELQRVQNQLLEIEVALESRLFSWDSFRDLFWQVVRFVGSGIVIGWFLRSWAG